MFLPVKNFAHDNFFYKITTKKLRKFAIFHVFCKTVRKIAGKNHIFTALIVVLILFSVRAEYDRIFFQDPCSSNADRNDFFSGDGRLRLNISFYR